MSGPRFAVIIPACNEEEALPVIVEELKKLLDPREFVIAVGANGCADQTVVRAEKAGVLVGETSLRGYGYGCQIAIEVAQKIHPSVEAYLFFAADGANDPADLAKLVTAYDEGNPVVLGQRTRLRANWKIMTPLHILANRLLGFWCGVLTGRFYCDLGPLRLISRPVFEALKMREWTYGWTIEPQILCARLKLPVREIDVPEHSRIAGEQKVSRVSALRTLEIGGKIFAAGWRARVRLLSPMRGLMTANTGGRGSCRAALSARGAAQQELRPPI